MFNLIAPCDEARLRRETEEFAKNRPQSRDEAIAGAARANQDAAADGREADFAVFHKGRQAVRVQEKFMKLHPGTRFTQAHVAAFSKWAEARGLELNDLSVEQLEEAWAEQTGKPQAQEYLEDLPAQEILDRQQVAVEEAEREEAADRQAFESSKETQAALQFIRKHPEYVNNDFNNRVVDSWMTAHGIKSHQITTEILEMAIRELASQNRLMLRIVQKPVADDFDPENCSLAELAEKVGSTGMKDDYVPDPNVRYREGTRF